MKVLHVPYTYPPAAGGGTEVYVQVLCRHLRHHDIESAIAAPGPANRDAVIDATRVRWFQADTNTQSLETLYGAGDPAATAQFERIVADERPDVVHLHALSPACSVGLARVCVRKAIPFVFTVHTPAVFCQQGALMRWGTEACTVAWSEAVCTSCVAATLGVPGALSSLIGVIPDAVAGAVARRRLSGGAWTALRLPMLMRDRLRAVDEVLASAARVVALAPWMHEVLVSNGVPADRIVRVPHGVELAPEVAHAARPTTGPVRLMHLGRLDPLKGTMVVVEALAAMPSLAATLDVFGIDADGSSHGTSGDIRKVAARDPRIRLEPAVPHHEVPALMARFDAVLVPSQWFETGPLVVLEAFAAGTPVIGSRLGGIADKVRHEIDGLLVDPCADRGAWQQAITRCVEDRTLLPRLAAGIVPPRTAAEVAADMAGVYQAVLPAVAARP